MAALEAGSPEVVEQDEAFAPSNQKFAIARDGIKGELGSN